MITNIGLQFLTRLWGAAGDDCTVTVRVTGVDRESVEVALRDGEAVPGVFTIERTFTERELRDGPPLCDIPESWSLHHRPPIWDVRCPAHWREVYLRPRWAGNFREEMEQRFSADDFRAETEHSWDDDPQVDPWEGEGYVGSTRAVMDQWEWNMGGWGDSPDAHTVRFSKMTAEAEAEMAAWEEELRGRKR